jgi:uncharacterized membrane protein (DUF485 family)
MRSGFPSHRMLWLIAGFTLWSVTFLGLYMVLTLGCAFGWHESALIGPLTVQRTVLVALFALAVAVAGLMVVRARERARGAASSSDDELGRFFHPVVFWVTLSAFAATVATYVPVLALTTCH